MNRGNPLILLTDEELIALVANHNARMPEIEPIPTATASNRLAQWACELLTELDPPDWKARV